MGWTGPANIPMNLACDEGRRSVVISAGNQPDAVNAAAAVPERANEGMGMGVRLTTRPVEFNKK
jgi:hypothetical protein